MNSDASESENDVLIFGCIKYSFERHQYCCMWS
ncbi:hypothetical protein FOXG_20599 [Fusarium oxysporum f. sp. lycopersici 4287]|nr:hypothetical protein FOXG_20599 [Fusarium oxysporum f. sp. lycopersici 4287]EXK29804.1 hypothetical protein FOMG_14233 [Fusarium oxysporum f. sp. melonis 26406]KNB11997.1 hypothetical protein FOXG_20599 [Fusarium oxysporum f. sp. lycopersici 4287]